MCEINKTLVRIYGKLAIIDDSLNEFGKKIMDLDQMAKVEAKEIEDNDKKDKRTSTEVKGH